MMSKRSVFAAVLAMLAVSACTGISPTEQAPDARTGCSEPFRAVTVQSKAAIRAHLASLADEDLEAGAAWQPDLWQSLVDATVRAGEHFLDDCLGPATALDTQPALLEEMTRVARVLPDMTFTIPPNGESLAVEMTIPQDGYVPSVQIVDSDGDGVDELILHTQLAYFSPETFFAVRGGLSILYALHQDGWHGEVIWPVPLVDQASGDYPTWAQEEQYFAQQQEWQADRALQYPPVQQVRRVGTDAATGSSFLALSGSLPGALDDTSELDILRWDRTQPSAPPQVVLRLAWHHWCGEPPWTMLPSGSIHIAARPAFPEHGCPALEETMFVLDGGAYTMGQSGAQTPAAVSIRDMLARQLHVGRDIVAVTEVEPVEWSNTCLDAAAEDEVCAESVVPGYRLVYTVNDEDYVYHSDPHGYQMRLVEAPEPAIGGALLTWISPHYDGGCRTAVIGFEGVAFGRCGGVLLGGNFGEKSRAADLAEFASTYAPFEGELPTATVVFDGHGDVAATPAEQRMIAEWAELVQYEAVAGGSDVENGRVIVWRQGGDQLVETLPCQELGVYLSGEVRAGSCPGAPLFQQQRMRLNAGQLADFYALHDAIQSFEGETDGVTGRAGRLTFRGLGTAPATDADQTAVEDFMRAIAAHFEPLLASGQAGWPVYEDANGYYRIQYPPSSDLFEEQWPGVDGVLAPAPDTAVIRAPTEFLLGVTVVDVGAAASLADLVHQASTCADIAPENGQMTVVAGLDALAYPDVACGPYGSTHYYVLQNGIGYRLIVEAGADTTGLPASAASTLATFQIVRPQEHDLPWK